MVEDDSKGLRPNNICVEAIYKKASEIYPSMGEICNQKYLSKILLAMFPQIKKSKIKDSKWKLSFKGLKFNQTPESMLKFDDIPTVIPQNGKIYENTSELKKTLLLVN